MALALIVISGRRVGEVFRLHGGPLVVGRARDCDIQMDDDGISRRHCVLTQTAAGWLLEDDRSSCGTFVNGNRLPGHVLACGDRVLLGAATIVKVVDIDDTGSRSSTTNTVTPPPISC